MEAQFEAARLQMEQLEKQARCCSEESDEGLGHSGSDGESNRTGSPTLNGCNGTKMENPEGMEGMVEVDADGKRKEDLYKCRFCDRTFCYLCHLKVHERVHTGEKPYKCSYCDVTFSQLGSLTVHMRIHTGEKPYECRICLKKFRHINSLRRHQRQVHRKTPAEVDAAPRGADCMPLGSPGMPMIGSPVPPGMAHPLSSPQAGRSLAGTPQPYHPFPRPLSREAPRALKSALEMRSMSPYSSIGINSYAAQMAQMNPYVRQMQQQQIQQQWQQQQQLQHQLLRNALPGIHSGQNSSANGTSAPLAGSPPSPLKAVSNHSISSMIDSSAVDKQINKPKKLGFSISAIVGEESEPEEIEEISNLPTNMEEVVDVVSEEANSDQEALEPAQSPCHSHDSTGNDSHDSGNASAGSTGTPPLIDDDLRRALTIDPRTLSPEEKQRLRQKLAEIALRNISQDSGVCSEQSCC